MFQKPKQRNLRGRTHTDTTEDDGDNGSNISTGSHEATTTTVQKPVIKKIDPPKALLSFGDDEGDTEEFKVNKTRESRRMAKEVKKQQRNETNETKTNIPIEKFTQKTEEIPITRESNNNAGDIEIKFKPLQIIPNKTSTNAFTSSDTDIQRLRREMRSLNGRIPDSDDPEIVDEILEGNDDDNDDTPLDDTQRSVRLMLRSGIIPDPTMIHAARKRRQMARETGLPSDYISLNKRDENGRNRRGNQKSRLVRDDENDVSDESEPEDRLIVSMDRNKNRAESERQKNRDRFLELEQGSDNEDDDEEFHRFEHEQIRKGVSSKVSAINSIDTLASLTSASQNSKVMPDLSSSTDPQPMEVEIIRDLPPAELPPILFDDIKDRLRNSLQSITGDHIKHQAELENIRQAYEASKISMETNRVDYPKMEKAYRFYQECRAYLFAFLECYNEKMINIMDLEDRWLLLYKQRTSMIINRRQEDFKDQDREYPTSKAAAFINGTLTTTDFRIPLDQKQQRRATEREARRLRRRKDREQITGQQHYDGMSTDDEENQSDINTFLTQKQEILSESEHVLDDVSDEFGRSKRVKRIFEQWKFEQSETYAEAYIEICLPKLFSPIIRLEMIDWKPFEASCRAIEDYRWYQELLFFGINDQLDENEDFSLIPMIVEKVVIPKLTIIIESIYDPLSATQTKHLVKMIETLFRTYPTMNDDSVIVKSLLKAIVDRLQRSLDDDIYIPLYPKEIIALGSSNATTTNSVKAATEFFFRQFWTCVKLLGNITSWSNILSLKTILDLSIDGLLNRYILLALRNMDLTSNEMVTRCLLLAKCFPMKQWLDTNENVLNDQLKNTTLPALENFCSFLNQLAQEYSNQYFSATDKDKKMYKENIRQIRVIFVHLHAFDHALELTNQYEIK